MRIVNSLLLNNATITNFEVKEKWLNDGTAGQAYAWDHMHMYVSQKDPWLGQGGKMSNFYEINILKSLWLFVAITMRKKLNTAGTSVLSLNHLTFHTKITQWNVIVLYYNVV